MIRRWCIVLVLLVGSGVRSVPGQTAHSGGRAEIFVGGELERYLRFMQSDGRAALYPWSIAGLSPREIDRIVPRDSAHPWAGHYDFGPPRHRFTFELIPPTITTIENTTFPFGSNDGAIWAGRGITGAVQAGFAARYGRLSLTLAPMAFSAQNASFVLESNGRTGNPAFGDGQMPYVIDRPQRFGDGSYTVSDPGQSTLRLDLPGVTLGLSSANQRWGPGEKYPILLGNNAGGFPHGFIGTSAPLDLWLVRVHGRVVWGELYQSDYSEVSGIASKRFMSGLVGLVTPRGLPGLELGAARFFHTPWPAAGLTWRDFRKPLEGVFKISVPNEVPGEINEDRDNQLASLFFRWVFPTSGFEVYGEYAREDHAWNLRAYVLEPDFSGGYMLGLHKVWPRGADRFLTLRAEMVDLQLASVIRGDPGFGNPFYIHGFTRQGHTYRGQLLGADVGLGGAGETLGMDYYHAKGRWTFEWSRVLRQEIGDYWRTGVINPKGLDVVHSLAAEGLFFMGSFDVVARLGGAYEFNRNFQDDAFNLNAVLRIRAGFGDSRHRAR